MDNIRILLLSHAELCRELYNTMTLIMGKQESVSYIPFPYGADISEYKKSVRKEILSGDDEVLILIDLFGGSPFMLVSQLMEDPAVYQRTEVVTGMNLPMLLETVNKREQCSLQELADIARCSGGEGIKNLKEMLAEKK